MGTRAGNEGLVGFREVDGGEEGAPGRGEEHEAGVAKSVLTLEDSQASWLAAGGDTVRTVWKGWVQSLLPNYRSENVFQQVTGNQSQLFEQKRKAHF